VIRAAALLIVLTLAVAPAAAVVCNVWCGPDRHPATAAACHDTEAPPGVHLAAPGYPCDHSLPVEPFLVQATRTTLVSAATAPASSTVLHTVLIRTASDLGAIMLPGDAPVTIPRSILRI